MHTYIEKYTCRAGEADKLLRKSQAKFGDAPLPLGVRWRSERSGLDSGTGHGSFRKLGYLIWGSL